MKNEFLIERQGKTFVLFAGLLDEAHRQGLKRITTTLIQVPGPDNGNVAICCAEVETERGVYSGIGDASPANVARAMQNCLIRMAETRAKARALRDAVNVAAAAVEELSEDAGPVEAPAPQGSPTPFAPDRPGKAPAARSARITTERPVSNTAGAVIDADATDPATPAQKRMIEAMAKQLGEEANTAGLTRREASILITELRRRSA